MWKPQILVAIIAVTVIAVVVILTAPDHVEVVAAGAVTGIVALGMKLAEK